MELFQEEMRSARQSLVDRENDLARWMSGRTTLYLDTNHWVNLRKVMMQSHQAVPAYAEILALLERLLESGRVCCPVSSAMFEELMRQSDAETRLTTARLMDRISGGVCLQYIVKLIRREWRYHVWHKMGVAQAGGECPVWTKAGFWAGQDEFIRNVEYWWGKPPGAVAAWLDWMWSIGFATIQGLPDFTPMPKEMVAKFVQTMNDPQARTQASRRSFEALRSREKLGLLEAYKSELFKEPLPEGRPPPVEVFGAFVDGDDPSILPSLHLWGGCSAALLQSNRVVRDNDCMDYLHAASAIPYCDAFLCDGPMARFLNSSPLDCSKVYGTVIMSDPLEIAEYLRRLSRAEESGA